MSIGLDDDEIVHGMVTCVPAPVRRKAEIRFATVFRASCEQAIDMRSEHRWMIIVLFGLPLLGALIGAVIANRIGVSTPNPGVSTAAHSKASLPKP
jgi:hypothetical protein